MTPVVLTGDALLIDGCGRTDFQEGSSRTLYRSIHSKLWTLPNRTVVYPGHDYRNRKSCTIGLQKEINPRLNTSISLEKFQTIMGNLDLPRPKRIMESLPANYACGLLERTSGSSANAGTHGSQVRSSSTC